MAATAVVRVRSTTRTGDLPEAVRDRLGD